MEGLRMVPGEGATRLAPCTRCRASGCPWDRVAGRPICPDCQEQLALGEGEPLVERLRKDPCAACGEVGTVSFLTYPLHSPDPLQLDLCPQHFHALLGRRLDRYAFRRLSRQLDRLGLSARQVFLLHEAFYDPRGYPLQPIPGP